MRRLEDLGVGEVPVKDVELNLRHHFNYLLDRRRFQIMTSCIE